MGPRTPVKMSSVRPCAGRGVLFHRNSFVCLRITVRKYAGLTAREQSPIRSKLLPHLFHRGAHPRYCSSQRLRTALGRREPPVCQIVGLRNRLRWLENKNLQSFRPDGEREMKPPVIYGCSFMRPRSKAGTCAPTRAMVYEMLSRGAPAAAGAFPLIKKNE